MEDVMSFFEEYQDAFTIYVVEQRFAVGRGSNYFKSYRGKPNYLTSDAEMKRRISKILSWIQKSTPNIAELVQKCFAQNIFADIIDIVSSLSKLFTVTEHQAAGPEVLDPIIIQEGKISKQYLSQLITLHKDSILQPVIILILKDNDFDRAQDLLSHCPQGINVKMIRNSGQCVMYKVINSGTANVDEFIDAYARQCFSSCSRTQRDILMNKEWAENSIVKLYAPLLLKIRSNLLYGEKESVVEDILQVGSELSNHVLSSENDNTIRNSFICMNKLFNVYCHDFGGEDIYGALTLAKELNNEILLAHVYRYASFFKEYSEKDKEDMLLHAQHVFSRNNIEDHAVYCMNNRLIRNFKKDHLKLREFTAMQEEAIYNTPGLVGMSHILNNVGVAHLYSGNPDKAIECFEKGLDYAHDRIIQKLALKCNIILAKAYDYQKVEEADIHKTMHYIFENCNTTKLPFIAANYVMNLCAVSLAQKPGLATEMLKTYPINELIQNALHKNMLDYNTLTKQMFTLESRYDEFTIENIKLHSKPKPVTGIRAGFIESNGFDPTIFSAWL